MVFADELKPILERDHNCSIHPWVWRCAQFIDKLPV
jgi:hypothetical protein